MNVRLGRLAAAILIGWPVTPAAGQAFSATLETVPLLEPGQRVRVWAWESNPFRSNPGPPIRLAQLTGTLIDYHPTDSLKVRREALVIAPWQSRERTAYWEQIHRIDVPAGRNILGGAVKGAAAALAYGLMAELGQRMFCWSNEGCGPAVVWTYTGRAAVYTVPAGAVIGAFFTRWKRVF